MYSINADLGVDYNPVDEDLQHLDNSRSNKESDTTDDGKLQVS